MPYIQLDDTQFPLRVGAMRVGAAGQAEIPLPGVADPRAQAIVEVSPDHGTAIRRAHSDAMVRVNGVPLGLEPAPLLHGDKIEIGPHELLFGDDRKAGSTQFISMGAPAAIVPGAVPRAASRRTAATGGRLVSLVDGREYLVPAGGITIGRDAGCDVVVGSSEASRRHAEVAPTADGYVLRDISTNGVWVNGARVQQTALLGRSDVLRIGGEEFRFYADVEAPANAAAGVPSPIEVPAPRPATEPLPAPTPAPSPIPDPTPAPVPHPVPHPVPPTVPERPATPAPTPPSAAPTKPGPAYVAAGTPAAARAPLATLEVVGGGVLRGQRFEVRHPLANVGRGDHNDIVIADESVSDSHAKLQKREGRWFVVDVQSTNGTYVGGQRVTAEREITAGAEVRVGGVKLLFSPVADLPDAGKGTRVIAGASLDAARPAARPAAAPAVPAARPRRSPEPEAPARAGWTARTWVLLALTIGAVAYLLLQGR